MIRERKNCHLLLLPGSEPSRGTARLCPSPVPAPHPSPPSRSCRGTQVSAVSSWQTVELGKSRDTALLQRDLELPWRERFPTPDREHSKHENRGVPSLSLRDAFVFSCLPPSPRVPRHAAGGEQPKKAQAQRRGSQHPKIRAPAPQRGRGDKLRGAEKGAPASKVLQQREAWEVRLWGRVPCHQLPTPRSPWVSGWQVQDGEKTNKQTKQKNKTETNRTPEECNATTPSWRALQGGGWRSWVSNAINSFRVIPPSTLPCNSDPSVEV